MNDVVSYGVFAFGVVCAVVCFVLFHVYSGVNASFSSAKIGDVYNFEYLQPHKGDPERYMIKVVDVCTLDDRQISRLNATSNYRRYDSNFQRTNHLVTGESPDGTIRNFYAERVVNCRRPLLGGALFKSGVAAMMF
jgi:hypothetical protein